MSIKKKIALFGGSFDPVHTDHLSIALACHDDLGFDEVWLIPTFLNPFKVEQNSSVEDRLAMLTIIADQYPFLKINDYEIQQPTPSYTFQTVQHFLTLYADQPVEFAFIMGSDQLDGFERWDRFEELIQMIKFKVFLRSKDYNQAVVKRYQLEVFDFNNHGLSSTGIRNLEGLDQQIPAVNDYTNYHLLYLTERVASQMDPERFLHCLNVGQMAYKLAQVHGLDVKKALIAGSLHDIAKRWSKEKSQIYLAKWTPELLNEPVPIWHSFVGALHLKHDWLIHDEEIIQAVFNHTVGSPTMSVLDKVVFCADKISLERDYLGVEELREQCFVDLNDGFKALLKNQYEQVQAKTPGKQVTGKLVETYQHYIVKGNN